MYVYMCIYVCVYMYVYTYVCMYTHIRTYTYIYKIYMFILLLPKHSSNKVNHKNDNSNSKNVSNHTALKKSYLLHVSFT